MDSKEMERELRRLRRERQTEEEFRQGMIAEMNLLRRQNENLVMEQRLRDHSEDQVRNMTEQRESMLSTPRSFLTLDHSVGDHRLTVDQGNVSKNAGLQSDKKGVFDREEMRHSDRAGVFESGSFKPRQDERFEGKQAQLNRNEGKTSTGDNVQNLGDSLNNASLATIDKELKAIDTLLHSVRQESAARMKQMGQGEMDRREYKASSYLKEEMTGRGYDRPSTVMGKRHTPEHSDRNIGFTSHNMLHDKKEIQRRLLFDDINEPIDLSMKKSSHGNFSSETERGCHEEGAIQKEFSRQGERLPQRSGMGEYFLRDKDPYGSFDPLERRDRLPQTTFNGEFRREGPYNRPMNTAPTQYENEQGNRINLDRNTFRADIRRQIDAHGKVYDDTRNSCELDSFHRELIERRSQREAYLLNWEEELKEKEIELEMRESKVQEAELQAIQHQRKSDPLEEVFRERERNLEERMKRLQIREQDLNKREAFVLPSYCEEREMEAVKKPMTESNCEKENSCSATVNPSRVVSSDSFLKNTESTNIEKRFLFPKFSVCSGEDPKPKGEATYEEWKYEVNCTIREGVFPDQIIAQAIRKSLRGQAKRVLLPMRENANLEEIMDRLEAIFGNVASGESVLLEFYTTSQKADESVAAWGLRLEEILQKAIVKGHIREEEN